MDVTDPSSPPSVQPPSPMTYLHIDIIHSEILPKLPTKSLLRFKSVCKTFKTLISSPEFTLLHLRHSPSSDRLLIIPATTTTLYSFPLHSLSTVPTTTFNWPQPTISVVGSCNGLLLIRAITRFIGTLLSLIILNPITRTYIDVPSPVEAIPKAYLRFGFGFDDSRNDYKIVVVSQDLDTETRVTIVYSVHSMSWKVTDDTLQSDRIGGEHEGVLINNHLPHRIFSRMLPWALPARF